MHQHKKTTMIKTTAYTLLICFAGFMMGCSSSTNSNKSENLAESDSLSNATDTIEITNGGIPIFYNMYLSVEMSSLFHSIGATYNAKILNPPEKSEIYEVSTDKALNLGVYAVDLSYAKYFDQFEHAGKYLKNMQQLSSELGIPSEKFFLSLKRIENNLANKDSLVKIANDIYKTSEEYLKQNERGNAAALVVSGGWTEAMYIATSLIKKNSDDMELIERIAEQKYSVVDLMTLLKEYENEAVIKDLLVKYKGIKESLDKIVVDNKDKKMMYQQLSDLTVKIADLRKEIVN